MKEILMKHKKKAIAALVSFLAACAMVAFDLSKEDVAPSDSQVQLAEKIVPKSEGPAVVEVKPAPKSLEKK